MGGADDDIPIPDIPVHVYVIIGCVAVSLALSQILGLWLTGFKEPTPTGPVYVSTARTLHDKPSESTLVGVGDAVTGALSMDATGREAGEVGESVEGKKAGEVEKIKEEGDIKEDNKETEDIKEDNESGGIREPDGIKEKPEV
ncbi:hypothetical protein QC764_206278 [Podospora pseudoanserina]|uniref:Uncharacterized protein n=1 Tax=Podospora pseudoanserina TaxID=2609844 RepID=A0ABR0IHA3_9PEZI|nr:hypothetical protein QC764_206278 [Podospora pseudoanserina]